MPLSAADDMVNPGLFNLWHSYLVYCLRGQLADLAVPVAKEDSWICILLHEVHRACYVKLSGPTYSEIVWSFHALFFLCDEMAKFKVLHHTTPVPGTRSVIFF